MAVLTLECPDCGHLFMGSVFPGTKPPDVWVCSQCKCRRAAPALGAAEPPHPFETGGAGCKCCG
jgi:hypothetical protein